MDFKLANLPRPILLAGAAWTSRIVTAFALLASVRVLIDSIGLESYAVFTLLTGLTGWFALADMGIGVSVQNHISELRAKNQSYEDLIFVSGLLAVLLMFIMIILLYFISPIVSPTLLKNFHFLTEDEKIKLFFLTGTLSAGMGVGSIIYKIWYAEHTGYLSNIVPAIAAIVGLIGILLVRQAQVEDQLYLNLAVFIAPTAVFPLAALMLRQVKLTNVKRWQEKRGQILPVGIYKIIKSGFHFWLFAIMSAGVLQIDYIVMSQFLVAHDIAAYYISTKIFGLAFFVYTAILLALWPIFSESIAKRDWETVKQNIKKYIFLGVILMAACTILFIWLMPVGVRMLAPNSNIVIPLDFIILFGVYHIIRVWTDTFAVVLQSYGNLKSFWIYVPIQAVVSMLLQWILVPIYGVYGVILGLIASFISTVVWALPMTVLKSYRINKR
jgi:O-antigen/teichoic acid export membrane protein